MRTQVPSLFDGVLAKSFPHLVGAPEVADLKRQFEAGAATATAALNSRKERERLQENEAQRATDAAATDAVNLDNAASIPLVQMQVDDLNEAVLEAMRTW